MEQDIKVLEEMVEKSKDLREEEFYKLIGIHQIQAIANTINRNKELEELKDNKVLIRRYFDLKDNSIPVSLVEEKIEELNKKLNNKGYGGCIIIPEKIMKLENQIDILQELLERRK